MFVFIRRKKHHFSSKLKFFKYLIINELINYKTARYRFADLMVQNQTKKSIIKSRKQYLAVQIQPAKTTDKSIKQDLTVRKNLKKGTVKSENTNLTVNRNFVCF